jgi:hypothetical protein
VGGAPAPRPSAAVAALRTRKWSAGSGRRSRHLGERFPGSTAGPATSRHGQLECGQWRPTQSTRARGPSTPTSCTWVLLHRPVRTCRASALLSLRTGFTWHDRT